MAIDIAMLRSGGNVVCPVCNTGLLRSFNADTPDKATKFSCSHCGEKLILNIRMPSRTDKPALK